MNEGSSNESKRGEEGRGKTLVEASIVFKLDIYSQPYLTLLT